MGQLLDSLAALLTGQSLLLAIGGGTLAGLLIGLMPGLSGRIGLILFLPLALVLEPLTGAVFLLSMHAVVHTSGSIPAILFGVPTSASESATVIDGYPMMRAGRGGEAVGATIAASAIGGVVGALALMAFVPLARPIIEIFGSAEIAVMGSMGILSVAALAGRSVARGLAIAALGVVASTVGADSLTATQRFTFGVLDLWDGLTLAAAVTGLFVVPELLLRGAAPPPLDGRAEVRLRNVLNGFRETLRHGWLLLRTSAIGIFVGFVPGVGASVAVWLAYGHAVQTTKSAVPYGEGAVAGVIAAEAANNSKEGGSLAPTLLFGVPGSSGMAILLGAFLMLGIQAGPRLSEAMPGFVDAMAWTILLANLLAVPLCLALTPTMTRFAQLRRELVLPLALLVAVLAGLASQRSVTTLVELALFGLLGLALARANWPRAPFILGFVMGPMLESALSRAVTVYGWTLFERPGVQALLAVALLAIFFAQRRLRRADRKLPDGSGPALALTLPLLLLFAGVLVTALRFPWQAALLPVAGAALGLAMLALVLLGADWRRGAETRLRPDWPLMAALGGFFLLAPLLGVPLAAALFALAALRLRAGLSWLWSLVLAAVAFLFAGYLVGEGLGLIKPFDPIARILANALASVLR